MPFPVNVHSHNNLFLRDLQKSIANSITKGFVMQSTDVPAVDLDRSDTEFNGNIDTEDVVFESKTLPELSNDVVKLSVLESGSGVSGEGLEIEEEDEEDMEVDFVENSGLRAVLEGSDNLVEGNGDEENDFAAVLRPSESPIVCVGEDGVWCGTSEEVDNQGKTSFNSSAQQLFPKTVNEGIVGKEVEASGVDGSSTVIGSVVEVNEPSCVVENQAIGSTGDNVTEGGSSGSKGELQNQALGSDRVTDISDKVVDLVSSVVSHGDKSRKKGGFCTSDLVWGKVRSHPWWPAQIFDIEDASEQAKKHFKSKGYLLAYFGDQTFAWNDKAKLKPFESHFSQMAKQSTAEAFQDAVNCALDEAARRAEFGLSCHCIADDVYSRLKIQVINNAGIREKLSVREGRDRLYTPSTFEPLKFLDYVQKLAQAPHVEDSVRLEHVVAHAQMSAFYRWKGCYHLAEFGPLIGYVNNEADAPVSREREDVPQMVSDANVSPQEKIDDIRPQKRKKLSGDSGNSTKKVKRSSESMRKKGKKDASKEDDDVDSEGKTGRKFVSSSPKSRKGAKLSSNESKAKESRPHITPPRDSKLGLRVGESILRAALQLSQPSPLLKLDVSSHGKTTKDNGKSKQRCKQTEVTPFEKSSPDAVLSNFLLAAVDPLKEYSFLSSMISFFSDFRLFRDPLVQDIAFLQKPGESASFDIVGKSKEIPSESGSEEMDEGSSSGSESKEMGTPCDIPASSGFTKVDGKSVKVTELQSSMADEEMVPVDPELIKADCISTTVLEIDSPVSGSQQLCASENVASESGLLSDKDILQEESPTALTLKFTDMDSIPTEDKLNKIFSAFGPLKESETEVLGKKNCARVVFKRRVDAETAFSSSGKFETFGTSLVCYQLNYAPSPRKSPSPEAKRRRKDGTLEEGIAA